MRTIINYKTEIPLLFAIAISFIAPIKGLIAIILIAVLLDTIFAIYSVIKLQGVKYLFSDSFFNIVAKLFLYLSTLLFAYLIDKFIFNNMIMDIEFLISKSIAMLWTFNECKSMDETSQKLGNKPFMGIIKDFVHKIKDFKKNLNDITK